MHGAETADLIARGVDGEDEDEEEVPGVLIVRLRENLDFGKSFVFKSVDARFLSV